MELRVRIAFFCRAHVFHPFPTTIWEPNLAIGALDVLCAVEHMDGPQRLGLREGLVDLGGWQRARKLQVALLISGWMVPSKACRLDYLSLMVDQIGSGGLLQGSMMSSELGARWRAGEPP